LDRVGEVPAVFMSPEELRATLVELESVTSRVAEVRLRVLAAAMAVGAGRDAGATSSPAWLAQATRRRRGECFADGHLAQALEGSFAATGAAVRAGRVNPEQARVIVRAVQALTAEFDDLPAGTHGRAEAHLIELAAVLDAAALAQAGKRLFEVVCPEAADRVEGEKLARDEARARRLAHLSMSDQGDGTVVGRFRLPTVHARLLKKALETITAPRNWPPATTPTSPGTGPGTGTGPLGPFGTPGASGAPGVAGAGAGVGQDHASRMGQGLMHLLEHHLDTGSLPSSQGSAFTLVVTLSLEALLDGIGVAGLDTGGRISAGEARRLACTAGLIPMVLGSDSVPLDLGREARLHSKHQRIALAHRFHGCAAHGCDRPPGWTEVHHKHPWSQGGRTDLDNGIPLCPTHLRMADRPEAWQMDTRPEGTDTFHRRE
jgi:hypothetical protein